MKKIIFILSFYTFYLDAQSTHYFSKSYDFGNSEEAWRIGQCSDGLVLSSFTYTKSFTDIIKTDFDGKVIWKRSRSRWVISDMKVQKDTIYYLSGNVNDTEGKDDIVFHAMNSDGDSLFTRYLGTDAYESYTEFQRTEDGGYIFACVRDRDKTDIEEDKLIVFKTDKNGKQLWERHIGKATKIHYIHITRLEKMENDEYLINFVGIENQEHKNLMTKIRGDGTITLNNKEMYTDSLHEAGINLKAVSGNRLFGMVAYYSDTSGSKKTKFPTQMVFTDSKLNYLNKGTKFYKKFTAILWEYYEQKNGNFLACGKNRNSDTLTDFDDCPWVACFNSQGILKWDRIIMDFRYNKMDIFGGFADLTTLPNKDIILLGSFFNFDKDGGFNLSLTRTDSVGCPFPNCKGRLQTFKNPISSTENTLGGELANVKVFPNPAEDKVWIELYDESSTDNVKIQVFDVFGKLHLEKNAYSNESIFQIDVSNLASGTYLLRITNDKGVFSAKKFVKL